MLLSPNRTKYTRSIYSFFDWLGDVGGLLDGFRLIGVIVMYFYTFIIGNPLNAFLVNSIFKREHRLNKTVNVMQQQSI